MAAPPRPPDGAVVFDVQRFCLHDGPGIRTVVFFKGCGLACAWCHNPEAADPRPQLLLHPSRCLAGCGDCVSVCGHGALSAGDPVQIDFARCTDCGDCVAACPSKALVMLGRGRTADELLQEVLADLPFFRSSGGGVTFSGGEPLLQAATLAPLARGLQARGVHVAVETSGQWAWPAVEPVLDAVDLFLFDLKLADPEAHARWTGHDNLRIRRNLERLVGRGAAVELRTPIVPGVNTTDAEVAGLAEIVRAVGHRSLTLLPYNPLWEAKLRQLRTNRPPLGLQPLAPAASDALLARFAAHGVEATLG